MIAMMTQRRNGAELTSEATALNRIPPTLRSNEKIKWSKVLVKFGNLQVGKGGLPAQDT
jgi:hypothetical protein